MADKTHLPEGARGAAEQSAGVNRGGAPGRREVAQSTVRLTKFIQGSLLLFAVGPSVEFGAPIPRSK